jgi:quercetin dioxygenase-like cupin family protein
VSQAEVISLHDVDPVELPMGSWSRLLVTQRTVTGNASTMGYSVFKPGLVAADMSHSVEELAFVVGGRGAVRLEDGQLEVHAGQALFIPQRMWHTVVNNGDEDLVMVFSFPSPDYPSTERREPRT